MSRWDALTAEPTDSSRRCPVSPSSQHNSRRGGWRGTDDSSMGGVGAGGSRRPRPDGWDRLKGRSPGIGLSSLKGQRDFDEGLVALRKGFPTVNRGETDINPSINDADRKKLQHRLESSLVEFSALIDSKEITNDAKRIREAIMIYFQCLSYLDNDVDETSAIQPIELSMCESVTKVLVLCSCETLNRNKGNFSVCLPNADVHMCVSILTDRLRTVISCGNHLNEERGLPTMLRCLGEILAQFGNQLAAEETAERVVRWVLLPILEMETESKSSPKAYSGHERQLEKSRGICAAMDCIASLLSHKQHASAILAPLVVDITNEGEESQVVNPLRTRLLKTVEGLVLNENDDKLLCSGCSCLSVSFGSIRSIDRNNVASRTVGNKSQPPSISVPSMARRLRTLLERRPTLCSANENGERKKSTRWHALVLLSSLAQTFPSTMAAHWTLFLEETSTVYDPLESLGAAASSQRTSLLLSFIRQDANPIQVSNEERVAALDAAKDLLVAIPFQIWFGMNSRSLASRSIVGSGSLANRVINSLIHVLNALRDVLRNHSQTSDEVVTVVCSLAGMMISTVPFDSDARLVLPAVELLTEIGKLVEESTRRNVHGSIAVTSAANAIVKSIGGVLTQQGTLMPLPKPTRQWFEKEESYNFLFRILDMAVPCRSPHGSMQSSVRDEFRNILLLVLRMVPWVLAENIRAKERISNTIRLMASSGDAKDRLLGIKCVRQYLQGRNDFSADDRCPLVCDAFCPLLFLALSDTNSSVRATSAAAYGFLLRADWEIFFQTSSEADHFRAVLSLCVDPAHNLAFGGDKNASVRSEACKSIGNMCTVCLDGRAKDDNMSGSDVIVHDVTDVMLISIKDKNPVVRSMALFAIGNLALSLKGHGRMIRADVFVELCVAVYECLDDKNEKVVGNAIRTIGHLLYMVQHNFDGNEQRNTGTVSDLCPGTIRKLSIKIDFALDEATGAMTNLSWKQRSFAKKHAWGACHSIGLLLSCDSSKEYINIEVLRTALTRLIRCIEIAPALNEKVTAAAASALKSVSLDTLERFRGECTVLADGMAACLVIVFDHTNGDGKVSSSVVEDVRTLLDNFLVVSSATDALHSFSKEVVSSSMVNFLYAWMVDRGSNASSFDAVAAALHCNTCDDFDISIEQKFSSRAEHERKKEHSPIRGDGKQQGATSESATTNNDAQYEDEL